MGDALDPLGNPPIHAGLSKRPNKLDNSSCDHTLPAEHQQTYTTNVPLCTSRVARCNLCARTEIKTSPSCYSEYYIRAHRRATFGVPGMSNEHACRKLGCCINARVRRLLIAVRVILVKRSLAGENSASRSASPGIIATRAQTPMTIACAFMSTPPPPPEKRCTILGSVCFVTSGEYYKLCAKSKRT